MKCVLFSKLFIMWVPYTNSKRITWTELIELKECELVNTE